MIFIEINLLLFFQKSKIFCSFLRFLSFHQFCFNPIYLFRQAVDPVVTLVRDTVIPETGKIVNQAVETVPEDVKDWVGEGGKIAAKRVDAVVEYVGPRLSQLSQTINTVQEQLTESAGDALDQVAPTIVPALQRVVEELRETLDTAR